MEYFWIDIVAGAVVLIASIVGMCRGFFASLLSILGFVGTFILAYFFSDKILLLLESVCGFESFFINLLGGSVGHIVAIIVAFIATYLLIRFIIFILNHTVGRLFQGRGIGGVNTFMGFVLGAGKGVAYVALALVAINLASLIPTVKNWTQPAFEQTYVVGTLYNWVGMQLGNYFTSQQDQSSDKPAEQTPSPQNPSTANPQNS